MMNAAIGKLLQALAQSQAGSPGDMGFIFLDVFAEQIAVGFPASRKSELLFQMGSKGAPEPKNLPESMAYLATPIEVYGSPVGFLLTVFPKGEEARAEKLSLLGKALVTFAAEKNFELDDLSAALNRLFEERAFLYEITTELGSSSDLSEFCARLAHRVASILESPRALVCLSNEDRSEYRIIGAYGFDRVLGKTFSTEIGVSGAVIQSGKAELIEEMSGYHKFPLNELEKEAQRCLMAAPILSGASGGTLGALCALDGGRSGVFTSEEAKLLGFIGEYVASVVSSLHLVELKKEVQIAQRIIEGLLPKKSPEIDGYSLAGRLNPARVVGGDYFDFLPMEGNKTGVVIADVSGHTLPATLLMTVARAAFHWAAADSKLASPAEILGTVAKRLHKDLSGSELFMSMFLLVLGAKGRVAYANAGHPPAILYRAREKRFEELDAEGTVAGLVPDIDFEEKYVQLQDGDLLLLYTDGITEAMVPGTEDMFGVDRLQTVIRESASFPPDEIVEAIFQKVTTHAGGSQEDDLTVVVIKGELTREPSLSEKTIKGKAKRP